MQERHHLSIRKPQMEKRLKFSISRLFRSSLRSCQSQAISDVAQGPNFLPRDSRHDGEFHPWNATHHLSFPSICRPKYAEMIVGSKPKCQNTRSSQSATRLYDTEGRRCPPPSPVFPCEFEEIEKKKKKKKKKKKFKKDKTTKAKKKKEHEENIKKVQGKEAVLDPMVLSISSDSRRFFSSDEEMVNDAEPFYFSDSSSSFSSFESQRPRRGRKVHSKTPDVGVPPKDPIPSTKKTRKVQESVAVVKSSANPYGDFRRSMLEMIIEKRIYTAAELEELLECFLSLNSPFHHRVIVEVFSEILETLFPNWS